MSLVRYLPHEVTLTPEQINHVCHLIKTKKIFQNNGDDQYHRNACIDIQKAETVRLDFDFTQYPPTPFLMFFCDDCRTFYYYNLINLPKDDILHKL